MDAAGVCTAGVSVSTLAKCVKDDGSRSREGSGSGGGEGGAGGAHACFMSHLFLVPAPLFVRQRSRVGRKKRNAECWEFTRVDEHKLMSDLSET